MSSETEKSLLANMYNRASCDTIISATIRKNTGGGENMKKCKACQKEIDPKAKICPYCRSKQTSKAVSVISGIISIVVIIWVLGLIFGGSKSSSVNNTPALSSNGNSNNNVTTAQQSNSPSHDDLMKQNNPDIKHISTLTSDYLGKSFVLYANVEVGVKHW